MLFLTETKPFDFSVFMFLQMPEIIVRIMHCHAFPATLQCNKKYTAM